MGFVIAIDVHQHLWPEDVLRALEGTVGAPSARWRHGTWEVRLRGEPPFTVDPADHDPIQRAEGLEAAGVDRALLALSSPVGAEALPEVVDAWSASAATLPASLGWWAAAPTGMTAADRVTVVRDALGDGAAGLCVPSGMLRSIEAAEAALPLLAEVDRHGVPVFVHPGESGGEPFDPPWWSPATSYVAQMHAAWHAFHVAVRPELPGLRVVFALLAGLAPLHLERTVGRGASLQSAVDDPRSFYDTSSYGPAAIRTMTCAVGTAQLVHGTDHPVATVDGDPVAAAVGERAADLVRRDNPARALGYTWVPA